jgi:hypothetical protein
VKKKGPKGPESDEPAVDLTEVVKAYAAQAKAADELAQVDTTHLDTPEANPQALATLTTERTRTAREKIELGFERERLVARDDHQVLLEQISQRRTRATALTARTERSVTEALADADEAAAELTEVRAFERSASPATATRRLMQAVRGWRREEFAYAIAGSGLSAAGMSALIIAAMSLTVWGAVPIAVALEVVLTVRVIRLIGQRAELAEQHKGQKLKADSAGAKALTFLTSQIVGLLAVSVLINLVGLLFFDTSILGALGAVGAGAAALASWSAWQASVAAAETVRSNVQAWQGGNWEAARQDLRARAAGAHIPTLDEPAADTGRDQKAAPDAVEQAEADRLRRILAGLADEQIAALADRGTDALSVMLDRVRPEAGPARSDLREHSTDETVAEDGFADSDLAERTPEPAEATEDGSVDSDQAEREEDTTPTDAATRAAVERAEQRRTDALALWNSGWCAQEIAQQMGRDKRTVRTYLQESGVTADQMEQRVRDRVQAYIEHKGPHAETRAMAADLYLTRTEAKAARERLAADGIEVYAPKQ